MANQNFKVKTGLEVGTGVTISGGIVTATSFIGNFSGNATYAVTAGVSTYSGISGVSTFSGYSNTSGVSTFSGYSNTSGVSTFSDYSNTSGVSTFSGYSNASGVSTFSGYSNTSGVSTFSGYSNASGVSTFSGYSNASGVSTFSGYSNTSGVSTFSGYSNASGVSTYASSAGIATTTTNIPNLTGDVISNGTATSIASGVIINSDISASASIEVSKLSASTISGVTLGNNLNTLTLNTSGTGLSGSTTYNGSGSATFTVSSNATSANTSSAIVARDSSGNFSAGAITGTNISDSSGNVRAVPQNAQGSAYILTASDVGKHISINTGGVTIPASVFSIGDAVSIYNNSVSPQTIIPNQSGTSVTLYLAGTGATGNRTVSARGVCTVLCVGSNTFVIFGAGLS